MRFIVILFLLFISESIQSQDIYLSTFGDSTDHPIIYLHGGPGGSSIMFEHLVAPKLAEEGFFVITYDRRDEGRNRDTTNKYQTIEERFTVNTNLTFRSAFRDLDSILQQFNISKPTLFGNSFGGNLALLYADSFPDKVRSVIIAGTPLSYEETSYYLLEQALEAYRLKRGLK